jgi:large subunit ribosomal protein L22
LNEKNLFVSKILVNEGPRLKKIFPRARGRADIKQKKMSHVTIVLEEIKKKK